MDPTAAAARRRATLIGFGAVMLWSLLALTTVLTAPVPPFLLSALSFGVGGLLCLGWAALRGELGGLRRVPLRAYLFGTAGLFGYHALYFSALRLAPPAQAGLISYLWPLLIVLLSGLLPGERLTRAHVGGAVAAFAGAAILVLGRAEAGATAPAPVAGFALAGGAAVVWAVYSLGSRRLAGVPPVVVAVNCLATAALSALVHPLVEPTLWPVSAGGWLAVAALGLGPVGAAFYLWDIGVKGGDIQLLGTAAYAAPVLSTLALIAAGQAQARPSLLVAAGLIAGGAALAASAGRRRARPVSV